MTESARLFEDKECMRVVEILKAMGHPVRLRLVALLCDGEHNVGSLAESLGVPQTTVSQQLRILRMSGLVSVTRTGGFGIYRLAEPKLRTLISCLSSCKVEP